MTWEFVDEALKSSKLAAVLVDMANVNKFRGHLYEDIVRKARLIRSGQYTKEVMLEYMQLLEDFETFTLDLLKIVRSPQYCRVFGPEGDAGLKADLKTVQEIRDNATRFPERLR